MTGEDEKPTPEELAFKAAIAKAMEALPRQKPPTDKPITCGPFTDVGEPKGSQIGAARVYGDLEDDGA